jgi:hypothetical protein
MVTKKKSTTTAKRTVSAKSRSKKSSASKEIEYQTFKVASDAPTFFHARVTRQTFYWSFLLLFIIIMQLIIIAINVNATIAIDSITY